MFNVVAKLLMLQMIWTTSQKELPKWHSPINQQLSHVSFVSQWPTIGQHPFTSKKIRK
jgi:hypothetical protein